MNNDNSDKKEKEPMGIALGLGLGLLGGVVIGALTDNLALWIPVGLGFGSVLGTVSSNNDNADDDDEAA